jgi:hypothetical protein
MKLIVSSFDIATPSHNQYNKRVTVAITIINREING